MLKNYDIEFDFRVLGVLFFIWSIINFVNSILSSIVGNFTFQIGASLLISLVGFGIAFYCYFIGSKIVLRTLKHHENEEYEEVD